MKEEGRRVYINVSAERSEAQTFLQFLFYIHIPILFKNRVLSDQSHTFKRTVYTKLRR